LDEIRRTARPVARERTSSTLGSSLRMCSPSGSVIRIGGRGSPRAGARRRPRKSPRGAATCADSSRSPPSLSRRQEERAPGRQGTLAGPRRLRSPTRLAWTSRGNARGLRCGRARCGLPPGRSRPNASIVTLSSARHGPRSSFLNTYVARRSTSYGSLVVDVQIQPAPEALDHGHRARPPVAEFRGDGRDAAGSRARHAHARRAPPAPARDPIRLRWHTISNTAGVWSLIGLLARCAPLGARWVSQRRRAMPFTPFSSCIG
jgi:hypothetical protein